MKLEDVLGELLKSGAAKIESLQDVTDKENEAGQERTRQVFLQKGVIELVARNPGIDPINAVSQVQGAWTALVPVLWPPVEEKECDCSICELKRAILTKVKDRAHEAKPAETTEAT